MSPGNTFERTAARGHGDAVVGPNLQVAVFRAIYTEVNANLQIQATMLGGPITFLNQYEAQKSQGWSGPGKPGSAK